MSDQYPTGPTQRTLVERFFGGSPGGVILRLVLMSLLVGFLMSVFGVSPRDVVNSVVELFNEVLRDGFGIFRDIGAYIATGAILVVPIWFLIRLSKARK